MPRFLDLQTQARPSALDGAFAAGSSQLAINYDQDVLLSEKAVPDGSPAGRDWGGTGEQEGDVPLGDFTATLTHRCGPDGVVVELTDGPA